MSRQRTDHRLRAFQLIILLLITIIAASCSKSGQPTSNSNSSSPPAVSSGGGDFEGTITMKMETEAQKGMEMTYFLKGRRSRIETNVPDVPQANAVMLWDMEGAKITTLMPSRKMYMTMDLKETAESMKQAAKQMKQTQGDEEDKFPKVTETGKQETIAGYTCEHWLIGDRQDLDMCVAKGLGYFGMGGQGGGGIGALKTFAFNPKMLAEAAAHPEWVKLLEGGAFPLKISALEDGKVKMNMEATKIERKSLDDALFTVPPDYKEFNTGNITPGLGKPK